MERKTDSIFFRVRPSTKKWLNSLAVEDDRPLASIVNRIIESKMQETESKKKTQTKRER